MTGNVVNLRRFRKQKARADKAKEAEAKRRAHGLTREQKEAAKREEERERRRHEGARLEPGKPEEED